MNRPDHRSHRSTKTRRSFLDFDRLEVREVLSTVPVASPMFAIGKLVSSPNPPSGAYTPAEVAGAYGFSGIAFGSVKGDGTGETIAIIDAYDDPNLQADLNVFDSEFGLAATTVTKVNQSGGSSLPGVDSTGGWELEESLDVEWAHAMAPGAKIVLVEATSPTNANLLSAVQYASGVANVVSMSWGGGEFSGQLADDADFTTPGVVYVASSGDSRAPVSWPASSPNVVAVGGTTLTLGANNTWASETGWSGSGGGPSAYETQPSYQKGVVTQTTTQRANPDVAYNANPSTGYAVYDSDPYSGTSYGWIQVGGTSAGAPQWSALLAIADQGRSLAGQAPLNASTATANPQQALTLLYQQAGTAAFHDITSGTSTGRPNYTAGPGYDYVTGLGSPVANLVVQALDGNVTTPTPSDTLVFSAPSTVVAGVPFNVTVTADAPGGSTDKTFNGTVNLTGSDGQETLPVNVTLTGGVGTFSVTLRTAGTQSLTAVEAANASITTTDPSIAVSPAAASSLILAGLPTSATVGAPVSFTVTAKDPFGNVATGYTGTVTLTGSDTAATYSPATYTYTTADKGVHTFSVTFATPGTQSLTVSDKTNGLTVTSSGITVTLAAPTNLAATAVSTSQINLGWTGAAGATGGYLIQESTGGGGFSTIATVAAGTTTYNVTGLAAGTTYSFRVAAVVGSTDSAYSNTASATTLSATGGGGGGTTSGSDSLWSNSYVPPVNAYGVGSYELGVRFESSVAGQVTGVRYYKETWMNGGTQVGHLWSSNGTLLASVTFTGETSSGWQQATFSSPVTIAANTVYVVSYSNGSAEFDATVNYFNRSGVTTGPLTALANNTPGGDGVFSSGGGTFPGLSSGGDNFWVDLAFTPSTSNAVVHTGGNGGGAGVTNAVVYAAPSVANPGTTSDASDTSSTSPTAGTAPASWTYRRAVPQALAAAARNKWGWFA